MEDQIVSYDVGILAQNKGVMVVSEKGYYNHGNTQLLLWVDSESWNGQKDFICYAPTQSLLQKYLREIHNIHIEMLYIDQILKFQAEICMMNSNTTISDTKCGNYEDVLEEALEIALNLIKDDNNR